MKPLHRPKLFSAVTKGLFVLLTLLALPLNAPAQPTAPQRWLFVFDLSATMKKRLPATEEVLKNFFATSAEGRLQDGDNLAVWTYDQKMHGGQCPLTIWKPEQATTLATNLAAFLRSRNYADGSQLAALQPALNNVITNSERLTIVIFCDGSSDLVGTPYDGGISQSFLDGRDERKKSRQPFMILIRTLSGKFIGCTVNFPPGPINMPLFLAPPPPTNLPPPVVVPDLVIVGTKVGTSLNDLRDKAPPATNPIVVVTPPTVVASVVQPIASAPVIHTNAMPAAVPPSAATAQILPPAAETNLAIAAAVNGEPKRKFSPFIYVGAGLFAVVVVVILIVRATRRPQSSLISSSMHDDLRRK